MMNSAQAGGHDPGRNFALLEQLVDFLAHSVAGIPDQRGVYVDLVILHDFQQIFVQAPSLLDDKNRPRPDVGGVSERGASDVKPVG